MSDTHTTMRTVCHQIAQGNRLSELQQQIADEAAREDVRNGCMVVHRHEGVWRAPTYACPPRALEYLALRNLIEYSADGKLVRILESGT